MVFPDGLFERAPYRFDWCPQVFASPGEHADVRHIFWLFDVILAAVPPGGSALEIGCGNASTSTAFVEASKLQLYRCALSRPAHSAAGEIGDRAVSGGVTA